MAGFALISWPLIAIALFAAMGPARGLIWSVVVGYLFLPESYAFDVPGLPAYDKLAAIALGAALGAALFRHRESADVTIGDLGFRKLMLCFLAILLLSPVATVFTNPETLVNGNFVRPGLSIRDVISMMTESLIRFVPLLLAWRFLVRAEHHRELLIAMIAMGLIYTFLVLFELRMSPQLNRWIYGYFAHSWQQHLRGDGYRPIVFLRHGLWLGFFLFTVAAAAFALSREKNDKKMVFLLLGCWVTLVLVLSRNLGATLLAVMLLPVVLFVGRRLQLTIVTVIAVFFLVYPVLKQAQFSPDGALLSFAGTISEERAASLKVRQDNEARFLARGLEKPAFGWGGWGRGRVFDERGRDQTIADGAWVLVLVQQGWMGYIGFFGLLCAPIFFLRRTRRRKEISPAVAGMLVMTAGNLLYLIPNSTLSPIGLLVIGAMAAFVQYDTVSSKAAAVVDEDTDRTQRKASYTRFAAQKPVHLRR